MPTDTESLAAKWIETPLGRMIGVAAGGEIVYLEFADECDSERPIERVRSAIDFGMAHPLLETLAHEMGEYFAGRLTEFSVPAAPQGSAFEHSAWTYLQTIPYGQTRSYGQQARAIAGPNAARAAGRANGANPIAILIPCHRVIGADGSLTGYGGGMHRKRWLLDHERRYSPAETGTLFPVVLSEAKDLSQREREHARQGEWRTNNDTTPRASAFRNRCPRPAVVHRL